MYLADKCTSLRERIGAWRPSKTGRSRIFMQAKLQAKFAEQHSFTVGYSPLYAHIFGLVAQWLDDPADPLVAWLLQVSEGRPSLDVTLLLPAALHREMLLG